LPDKRLSTNPARRRIRRILFVAALLLAGCSWVCGLVGTARGMMVASDAQSETEWLINADDPTYLWNGRIVVCAPHASRIQVYDLDGRLVLVRNPAARGNSFAAEFRGGRMIVSIRRLHETRIYNRDFDLVASADAGERPGGEAVRLPVRWSLFGVKVEIPDGEGSRLIHLQPFAIERLPQMPLLGLVHGQIAFAGLILLAAAQQRSHTPASARA